MRSVSSATGGVDCRAQDIIRVGSRSGERRGRIPAQAVALGAGGAARGGRGGNGALVASGRGRALQISAGALYDWLQQAVPVYPERGLRFAVRPDTEAEDVAQQQRAVAMAWRALDALHAFLEQEDAGDADAEPPEHGGLPRAFAVLVKRRLIEGLREAWQELRGLEHEVAAVAGELHGDDPLLPDLRAVLDDARSRFKPIAEGSWKEAIGELPEPDVEYRKRVARLFRPDDE